MMYRANTTHARKANRRVVNRRKKKSQHLLDVNIRSDRAKAQRNQRIVLFLCKILLVFSICGGLVLGGRVALNRLFFSNPTYTLDHIEVQGDGTLSRGEILKVLNLREGINIFAVKLPVARQALLDMPQVGDAEIQRLLPDTLKISIHERHPVAWLVNLRSDFENLDHSQNYMLDTDGVVLKNRALLPEYLRLPVISGYPVDGLRPGKSLGSPEVTAALTLLHKASDSLAGRFDIQFIDLSQGYCLDVTDREKTSVRFAFDDLDKQLQRLGLLLDYCDSHNQKMDTVNLMVQRNVPVTFVRLETTDLEAGKKLSPESAADTLDNSPHPVKKAQPVPSTKKRRSTSGKG